MASRSALPPLARTPAISMGPGPGVGERGEAERDEVEV